MAPMTRVVSLLAIACAVALAAVGLAGAGSPTRPAPQYADATAGAKPLVIHFFLLLEKKDVAGLEQFLSPAFQVQRADGSYSDKTAYLAKLPVVNRFWLSNLAATQAGPVLVVRYLARAEGVVNGKPYTPGPAPRLSTFVWNGARWQLA